MSEEQTEYITEAMDLLKGAPAAIIEQPRPRLVLREGLGEEWTVAWVKLSTAFKPHIKELRGAPLAVWLYISLSINKKGVAFPSIDKIAEDTGYSRNGVMDATKELEQKGYLKVRRGERKYNLYEPEFAAIGRMNEPSNESTKWTGPADESTFPADESTFSPNESSAVDLNKRNKNKQEIPVVIFDEKKAGIDWIFAGGKPVTEEKLQSLKEIDDFENMIDAQFSRFPLKWSGFRGVEQDNFRAFLKHPDQKGQKFTDFVDWWIKDEWRRENPPSNIGKIIQQWPRAFSAKEKPFTPIPTVQATAEKINKPEEKFVKMPDEVRAKLNKLNKQMEVRK